MCGIIGYIGKKEAYPILIEGLKRLEYRGYDSAGVAIFDGEKINLGKEKGKIADLENKVGNRKLSGNIGIAHTRWATHGKPSKTNAHPHTDCSEKITVVHNGIIENYKTLKVNLEKEGHKFISETDTEVLAHLVEKFYKGDLLKAVTQALKSVEGTYGMAIISQDEPDKIVVARNGSPLLIGVGKEEHFVASDASAILNHTRKVIYLDDHEIALITPNKIETITTKAKPVGKEINHISWNAEDAEKGGFPHFMLKEIFEQPETILNAMRGRLNTKEGTAHLGGPKISKKESREIERIVIIACGTAWHAGLVAKYMLEELAEIPTEVEYASEFRYRNPLVNDKTLVVAISQSGETADTLAAVREANRRGAKTMGIINVVGSTIAREVNSGGTYVHAGPEIGVASTKAFTSQLTALTLLTLFLGRIRNIPLLKGEKIVKALSKIPKQVEEILKKAKEVKKIAKKYAKYNDFLYLGRGIQYPIALEGALKLKEISYIHAEGYPSAEMKHGPIALIDKNTPSVFIALKDELYDKTISNIEEVKARSGKIIAVATEGNKRIKNYADDVIFVPDTEKFVSPLLTVVPLQLLSYYIALERGCDIDKPRNLAKSVTVE